MNSETQRRRWQLAGGNIQIVIGAKMFRLRFTDEHGAVLFEGDADEAQKFLFGGDEGDAEGAPT
jgi:hypothetical protein